MSKNNESHLSFHGKMALAVVPALITGVAFIIAARTGILPEQISPAPSSTSVTQETVAGPTVTETVAGPTVTQTITGPTVTQTTTGPEPVDGSRPLESDGVIDTLRITQDAARSGDGVGPALYQVRGLYAAIAIEWVGFKNGKEVAVDDCQILVSAVGPDEDVREHRDAKCSGEYDYMKIREAGTYEVTVVDEISGVEEKTSVEVVKIE